MFASMQGGYLNVAASDSKTNAAGGSNVNEDGGSQSEQGAGAAKDKAGGTKKDEASDISSGAAVANGADVFDGFGGDEGPAWDCLLLTKQEALAKISGKPQGAFVIRPSDKAYAAMSMVKPDGSQYNQHIEELGNGNLRLKTSAAEHATLADLVVHYASPSQSDLPCSLVEA